MKVIYFLLLLANLPQPAKSGIPGLEMQKSPSQEYLILLHGLNRSSGSMKKAENFFRQKGFSVLNMSYPSAKYPIDELAGMLDSFVVKNCTDTSRKISFLTHSMGGIVVRKYLQQNRPPNLGRVVMFSPPNQGSEVADRLKNIRLFRWLTGPAGQQLGTSAVSSVPLSLGPADYELGVITGDRSINWFNSLMIPGPDDGKVGVGRAGLQGMRDFRVIHASHPIIMRNQEALNEAFHFLLKGRFRTAAD